MGTHCLIKEFHPEFHVEVIRRPHTYALAQLVPYDVVLLNAVGLKSSRVISCEIAFTKSEIVLVSLLTMISSGSAFCLGWPNTVWRIM